MKQTNLDFQMELYSSNTMIINHNMNNPKTIKM